jgi:hypothetical protein
LPIVHYLEQIQKNTVDFIREFVDLLSSIKGKFSLSYHIRVYEKKNCQPLQVYPYDFLRNIYKQINEANSKETLIMKKQKILETTYEFLKGYLPIFENHINEFEIQIIDNNNFTETVKIFKNDNHEVERLVYKFLGGLKEIVSAIEYEPVDKKINSIDKADVLKYLNEGRDLMQCKWENKYLEEGKKAEPCAENYHAFVESQNREIKPFVEAGHVQDEFTSLNEAKIDSNSVFSANENINYIGSEEIVQVSHGNQVSHKNKTSHDDQASYDANIFVYSGGLALVWVLILAIIYVYRYFKKRRERKEFEQTINFYESP